MSVYEETGFEVEKNPNDEYGFVFASSVEVIKAWNVDSPAVTERVVVAEYPNGGQDVEEKVIEPEKGHWECTDDDIPSDIADLVEVPDDHPRGDVYAGCVNIDRYHRYTPEEIEENDRIEEAAQKQRERDDFIDTLPETVADTDAAICELYEMLIGE